MSFFCRINAVLNLVMTEASDLLQKLSLDSPPKTDNAVEVAKEVIFIFLADDVPFLIVFIFVFLGVVTVNILTISDLIASCPPKWIERL